LLFRTDDMDSPQCQQLRGSNAGVRKYRQNCPITGMPPVGRSFYRNNRLDNPWVTEIRKNMRIITSSLVNEYRNGGQFAPVFAKPCPFISPASNTRLL
jgi:hypothetical protein